MDDQGRGRLSHPDIDDNGRLRGRISDGPGGNRCRRRQQDRQARSRDRVNDSPGMMAAPAGGSTWETCPRATRAAWAPRWRAPCAEASQPAWRAAAPAAEAGLVLRAFVGARPAKPCLRLLKEREGKFKTHSEKTEVEVSSDTYPLRGKANHACGDTPRAPVSAGAAEGCPAVGFDAASTSDARGGDLPRRRHDGRGTNLLYGRRGRLLLGGHATRPDPPESPQLSWPRG
jgi:hypothetical protein